MADEWWQNDPIASAPSSGRVGYIPGIPKAKDPLDVRLKEIAVARGERDLAKPDTPSGDKPKTLPPAAASGIQANMESLRALDAAINSLNGRPQSIGPGTGALGDTFTQFNDPDGTDVRSRVGKIGAMTIHDLSGAAVSATEAPRFQPFVPTVTDRPEIARQKLRQFREALQAQIKEALDYYGPNNGYIPYNTPQAEEFLKSGSTANSVGGFGLQQDAATKELTPEQAAAYDAWWKANPNPTPEQLTTFGQSIGVPMANAKAIIEAKQEGAGVSHTIDATDPRVQQRIEEQLRNGRGAGNAAATGATDAITLGAADEISAAGQALRGSLSGEGSFGDLYGINVAANRGVEDRLQGEHPYAYAAGQLAGGLAIPAFGTSPLALARSGATVGGLYGFNSGEDTLGNRLANGVMGASAGGATGYGIGRIGQAFRRSPSGTVPDLVDPATGALNQPLEAMNPGQRVLAANQFGIDLPLDAAGGRTAAVIGKGLDIMPGSAGVMEDARRATEQQVAGAVDNVASRIGSSRTLSEGGAELQRGASERIERGKAVIAKAYNAIPIADAAPASNASTVATLQELTGRFASNPDLADAVRDPRLVTYLNAIEKGGLSWIDLKEFRSLIGEKIGDLRFGEGHSTKDLRALYGALSEDMRNTAASRGPKAINAFERANSLNRQNEELIEGALTRILGPDGKLSPEKAAAAVQAMTKGGKSTGDLKTLAQIRSATVKSGAWDEIAATMIRLGGQPVNSAGRDFSPATFVNWYADMAEPARNLLFGRSQLRTALDQFVAVNQRLMKVNALRNTSNTAGSMMAGGTVATIGAAALNPMLGLKLLTIGAGNYAMAKVWTNPAFVRWATGFVKAATPAATKAQAGRLARLAATNPELREPLISLQRSIMSAMNDNVATPLAASQGGDGNQN